MSRRPKALLLILLLPLLGLAWFLAIAAAVLLARLLVLGWLWALYPLGLAPLANNVLALALAAVSAFVGWRALRWLLPQRGPSLRA